VVPHGGFGSEGVFVFDHFQDCPMFPGGGFEPAGMFNCAQDQPLVSELVHEPLVVLYELGVVRAPDDGPVKLVDEPGVGIGVVGEGGHFRFFKVPPQDGQFRDLPAAGQQGCRESFHGFLELEKLDDLPACGLPHEGAHLRADLYETFVLKLLQGFPDGRTAYIELLCQESFGQDSPGRKVASQDKPADPMKEAVLPGRLPNCFEIILHT